MRRFVVGATVLLLLAGCGGDPKADPSPSTSPTPSASSTPTSSAPAMPDAAKANTKAGAIAFVKYYVGLINYAQATGDVRALRAAEDGHCQSCEQARDGVRKLYESGGSISGGDWSVESANAVPNAAIGGWVVDLNISYRSQTVSYGSAQPDKTNKAGRMLISVQVRRTSLSWLVGEWTRAS